MTPKRRNTDGKFGFKTAEVITIIIVLCSIVVTYAIRGEAIQYNKTAIAENKEAVIVNTTELSVIKTDIAVLKEQLKTIEKNTDEIKQMIKELDK